MVSGRVLSPVLVAIGDTHGTDGHRLEGATLTAVREADVVIHTGDFTTAAVLDAHEAEAAEFAGVIGNNDDRRVRERLPETRVVEALDRRFVVAHGDGRDDTSLSLLARQEDADAIVVGHSHMPGVSAIDGLPVINPGSHADPRWYRPAFARIECTGEVEVSVTLETPDGESFETATV